MHSQFKHIELFAGCGGMSLGLQASGFNLYLANELSPMAGETFAYNFFHEDLSQLAETKSKSQNVLWIKSSFEIDNLKERLRENPFEFSNGINTDIDEKTDFSNKLVIGNIDHFLIYLEKNKNVARRLKELEIDLLSGGPPCQGFSLAGKRKKDDIKNLLPLSFVKYAEKIQPKIILLENVKGITAPFNTTDGGKHYAFIEVAKTLSIAGYFPVCMLLNSKYFGVPQNRPRFILYGFRGDIFKKLESRSDNSESTQFILSNSRSFYNKVQQNLDSLDLIKHTDLYLFDIEIDEHLFNGEFLPQIKTIEGGFVRTKDALDDIISTKKIYELESIRNKFSLKLGHIFRQESCYKPRFLENHDHRNHYFKVKARFRIYQVLNTLNGVKQELIQVISGNSSDPNTIMRIYDVFKEVPLLITSGETNTFKKMANVSEFENYLNQIVSKKQSQRALKENEPAPAQLTIPDDMCHYSINELRTLTVREMARLQSFPDWFVFRSKVTTGGRQRSYEVPQYTQVGNAVPPLLAYELGNTINRLLKSIS